MVLGASRGRAGARSVAREPGESRRPPAARPRRRRPGLSMPGSRTAVASGRFPSQVFATRFRALAAPGWAARSWWHCLVPFTVIVRHTVLAPGSRSGVSPWAGEKLVFTSCAFMPISLRPFPPLAKGGEGGWCRHDPLQGLPMLSPSQAFRIPLARREESFSLSKAPASPPRPPFARGGKGSLTSFHPAHKNTRLEIVPPAQSTPTFHRPSLALASPDDRRFEQLGCGRLTIWPTSAVDGLTSASTPARTRR